MPADYIHAQVITGLEGLLQADYFNKCAPCRPDVRFAGVGHCLPYFWTHVALRTNSRINVRVRIIILFSQAEIPEFNLRKHVIFNPVLSYIYSMVCL